MPLTIALQAASFRTVTIQTAGRTAGYDQVEIQYTARRSFVFGVAPLVAYTPDGAGQLVVQSLNQGNTYTVRARELRTSDGARTPWTADLRAYTPMNQVRDVSPLSVVIRPAMVVVPEPVKWAAAGSQINAYPPTNLDSDSPHEQFATLATVFDFDTAGAPFDTIALLETNIPAAATWRVTLYATDADRAAGINPVFSTVDAQFHASPNLPGRPGYHGLLRLPAPRTERFGRITFSEGLGAVPPASLRFFTYGVVGLSRSAKNIAAEKVDTPLDYGAIERTRDGVPDRRAGFRGRRVEFEIALMTEAQWETQFSDLRWKIGLTDPVLVVPNTRAGAFFHDRILYGPLSTNRASQPHSTRFTQQLVVESLI